MRNPIYVPKGRAREYAELACNLFTGCRHGCTYCYVPGMPGHGDKWREAGKNPQLRPGVMEALEKQAEKMKGDPRRVFFCFTSDPFQDTVCGIQTMAAIAILHRYGIKSTVLTKAGKTASKYFKQMKEYDTHFGVTIAWTKKEDAEKWEPRAEEPFDRQVAIRLSHMSDLHTFVSLEPVIDTFQALEIIKRHADAVDEFRIGKWNHDQRAADIDWQQFAIDAAQLCYRLNTTYYLKNDLHKYAPHLPKDTRPKEVA